MQHSSYYRSFRTTDRKLDLEDHMFLPFIELSDIYISHQAFAVTNYLSEQMDP